MFVLSVHISKKKIIIFTTAFLIIALFAFSSLNTNISESFAVSSSKKYSIDASNNEQRIELLNNYG